MGKSMANGIEAKAVGRATVAKAVARVAKAVGRATVAKAVMGNCQKYNDREIRIDFYLNLPNLIKC